MLGLIDAHDDIHILNNGLDGFVKSLCIYFRNMSSEDLSIICFYIWMNALF